VLPDHNAASQVLQQFLSELVLGIRASVEVSVEDVALALRFIAGFNIGEQGLHVARENALQLLEVHVVVLAVALDVLRVDTELLRSILELFEFLLEDTDFVIRDVSQNALLNRGLGGHDVCSCGKETLEILLSENDV